MKLEGVFTALITPFKGGKVDFDSLEKLIDFQIKNKVKGLVVLGTTGETPTLESKEQEQIINFAVKKAKGKIIVGTGSYSTKKTIESTENAKNLGADAALIVTPYYNKPTDEGIFQHFKAVNDAVDIPIIIYNIQGRTGKNIEMSTMKRLANLDNVIGVKEASGNIVQINDVIREIQENKKNFTVLSGDDNFTLPVIALGGKGVVSVVSNLEPKKIVELTDYALKGNFEKARKLHFELMPLFKAAFIETNPIPIKQAMNFVGMNEAACRLPLCEMQEKNKEELKKVLKEMNYIK